MNEPSPAERRARSDLSRLARGGTLTLIGSVASSVLGFALTLLITHGLRATGAGVVFEAIALFAIVSNIAELGADTGLVRLVASFRATGRVRDIRPLLRIALWPVAVSGAAFAAAGVVWAPQLARAFIHGASRGDAVGDIRVFSLFLPAAVLTTVALSGTRGFGTMRPYVAVQSFVVPALRPILVSIVLLAGMGAVAVGVAWAVPLGVGCTLALSTLFLLLRQAEQRDRSPAHAPGPVGALAAEFWRFCIPRGISVVFTVALASIDVLMVGALRTTQEAGVYATAMRFLGVGQFSLQAASLAIAPQLSALIVRGDRARARSIFQTATSWLVLPAWPTYLILGIYAPLLLRVFGPQFAQGSTALLIMVPAFMIFVGTGNNKVALLMGGKSSWALASIGISVALNVVLNLILIPHLGIEGAAIAYAVSLTLDTLVIAVAVWAFLGLHPFGRAYPVLLAASLLTFGAIGLFCRVTFGATIGSFALFLVLACGAFLAIVRRARGLLDLGVFGQTMRSLGRPTAGDGGSWQIPL